jgi:nucleotide-binding universal stress UspA family protein
VPAHHSDVVTTAEVLARPRSSRDQRPDITLPPVFLVPVNYSRSSEAALHLALLLAVHSGAKLVVVRIVPAQRRTMAWRGSEDARSIDRETERLQAFVDRLFSDGPAKAEYELIVAADTAADRKIAELAAAHSAALIVMGASGDDLHRRLFGSIVERTRRRVACPVVTIGARSPRTVDGSGR